MSAEFHTHVQTLATSVLLARIGDKSAATKAAARVAAAFHAAMRATRDPSAFERCTEASIVDCIGTSYETDLYPGGPNPVCYLVPQAPRAGATPELQWRITHRGLAALSQRAGFTIRAIPIDKRDRFVVSFGEVTEHTASPDSWPRSLDDLAGICVVVQQVGGAVLVRGWVPTPLIRQRMAKARDKGVWQEWPVEMAQKTAIKYAAARGELVSDSPELRAALEADVRGDAVDHGMDTADLVAASRTIPRALPDNGPPVDFTAENERLNRRERVVIEAQADEPAAQATAPTLTPTQAQIVAAVTSRGMARVHAESFLGKPASDWTAKDGKILQNELDRLAQAATPTPDAEGL